MHSFEGFPSLVIATSVDKRRLYRLTVKVKPNFVSADTAHDLRADSAVGSLQLMRLLHEAVLCCRWRWPIAARQGGRPRRAQTFQSIQEKLNLR